MLTVLIFIIILGVLIFVHEFGHFIMAKRAGMKVEEFGFGFPPRIFGVKRGETIYSINWIPFGGFVKIYGELGEARDNPRSFTSKPISKRAKVAVAGVVMNFLLAVVLLTGGSFLGIRIGLTDNDVAGASDVKIQIISVSENSPAAASDLKSLDSIEELSFGNKVVKPSNIQDVQNFINNYKGQEIKMKILHGDELIEKKLTPRLEAPEGEGAIGISLAITGVVSYPWHEAIWRGAYSTGILTVNIFIALSIFFKNLIVNGKVIGDVAGPIGIAVLTGQASKLGFSFLIQFVSILSINLAILNIIPFPALDGGRLLLLGVEKVKRKPIDKRIEGLINAAGFAFLIALMIWITLRDIGKFFG